MRSKQLSSMGVLPERTRVDRLTYGGRIVRPLRKSNKMTGRADGSDHKPRLTAR